ncbi:MAG: molybdopterin adenylyltransferase [Candidatus Eremiobacteraeota bacterium]|nr:molybdopterin adenylyltransferase [Candidatus Eremiobacteraeota bacterium]
MSVKIGLLTVSDRAHRGEYEDRGGPAMEAWMRDALSNEVEFFKRVVPDEVDDIVTALEEFEGRECCLVLTTGGTGPAPRDVTPEATERFCERILDGFGEEMRRASLKVVPTAILSRQMAGTRGKTLVINLPGKPSAIDDCLRAVFPAVPYCIDLMEGPRLETKPDFISCFRPQKKANG